MNAFKFIPIVLLLASCTTGTNGLQFAAVNNSVPSERTIEVTGSAEMTVKPECFNFEIEIEEYYEEEFQKGKREEDFKTKVTIEKIEKDLLEQLKSLGIDSKVITIDNIGSNWRAYRQELKIRKMFVIKLEDLKKADQVVSKINLKGVSYMRIGELKHSQMQELRKKVKTEALAAAKMKAEYLLQSLGKKPGDIVSIKEIDNSYNWFGMGNVSANYVSNASSGSPAETDLRSIKMRYEIQAVFTINQ